MEDSSHNNIILIFHYAIDYKEEPKKLDVIYMKLGWTLVNIPRNNFAQYYTHISPVRL